MHNDHGPNPRSQHNDDMRGEQESLQSDMRPALGAANRVILSYARATGLTIIGLQDVAFFATSCSLLLVFAGQGGAKSCVKPRLSSARETGKIKWLGPHPGRDSAQALFAAHRAGRWKSEVRPQRSQASIEDRASIVRCRSCFRERATQRQYRARVAAAPG